MHIPVLALLMLTRVLAFGVVAFGGGGVAGFAHTLFPPTTTRGTRHLASNW